MARKDTTKQDIRSLLLKSGTVRASTPYVASNGISKINKEDSMRMAIASRKNELSRNTKG